MTQEVIGKRRRLIDSEAFGFLNPDPRIRFIQSQPHPDTLHPEATQGTYHGPEGFGYVAGNTYVQSPVPVLLDSNTSYSVKFEDDIGFKGGDGSVASDIPGNPVCFLATANAGLNNKDRLRVALGTYWDYNYVFGPEQTMSDEVKEFRYGYVRPAIFYNQAIAVDFCSPPEISSVEGAPGFYDANNLVKRQRLVLVSNLHTPASAEYISWSASLEKWGYLIKHGLNKDGQIYLPIVATPDDDGNNVYFDHYHETSDPFSKNQLNVKQFAGAAAYADVKTYYDPIKDFQQPTFYQDSIASDDVTLTMPSIYSLLKVTNGEYDLEDLYWNIGGPQTDAAMKNYPFECNLFFAPVAKVDLNTVKNLLAASSENTSLSAITEDYTIAFAGFLNEALASSPGSDNRVPYTYMEKRFKNVVFSNNIVSKIDQVEKYKKHFPLYAEIEFSTKKLTEMGDLFKKTMMNQFFSKKIAETVTMNSNGQGFENSSKVKEFVNYSEEGETQELQIDGSWFGGTIAKEMRISDLSTVNARYLDIFSIIKGANGFIDEQDYYTEVDLGDESDIQNYVAYLQDEKTEKLQETEYNNIFKILMSNVLASGIVNKYKQHERSFEDILAGKPAYSEDVFYRIEKQMKHPTAPNEEFETIQNIIVPNTSDLNIFKYIDTQVKYGAHAVYKYNVYVHRLVFGTKYFYTHPQQEDGSSALFFNKSEELDQWVFSAHVDVHTVPNIVLLEDLYFSTPNVSVLDSPPTPPEVEIVPYRAVNNEVLIVLNGTVDTFRDYPISILPSDEEHFKKVAESQLTSTVVAPGGKMTESYEGKIKFSSDDLVEKFQIFKIDKAPLSWSDFKLEKTIGARSYKDTIMPNKKYFYAFRSVDSSGHISNPTAIYEVELVDDHGAVKPMIRLYEFPELKVKTPTKQCQKYIYIKPSLKQVYSDKPEEDLDYMFTQRPHQKIKNKKRFKVRLTSRSTGKRLDINVAFVKKSQEDPTTPQ